MALLEYQNYYLVGIKGVAMTALAQCLLDVNKSVQGWDVAESFVTQPLLDQLSLNIDTTQQVQLPPLVECVIYTSAHQGRNHVLVQAALSQKLAVYSHAQALAQIFNKHHGIAVAGVGGKSTTSAMIAWILEKTNQKPSYAVGVGNIPGLERTGRYQPQSAYFVAEADEYAANPEGVKKGEPLISRFSYLHPNVSICTNIAFDHPDVYKNEAETLTHYQAFLSNTKPEGTILLNSENEHTSGLITSLSSKHRVKTFGESLTADYRLSNFQSQEGLSTAEFSIRNQTEVIELKLPGLYNIYNATAALAAIDNLGLSVTDAIEALKSFRSTQRRFEFIGEKSGVTYYDDYAHHPHEVFQVIKALNEWYPNRRKIIAFQSHTFSRTKELFSDFVAAFREAQEVIMIDIFASAREEFDASISSDILCTAIQKANPQVSAKNLKTVQQLADYLRDQTTSGDVVLTIGAGDIYKVHQIV